MRPLVSVIICTYRRQEALRKCIESILRQEYTPFEIIVAVPTEETDTLSILKRYSSIKIIFQNLRKGLPIARNRAIAIADGEIVAFIDNDGIADRYWLENLVKGYSSDRIGAVGGIVYDSSGNDLQFKNGWIDTLGDVLPITNYSHPEYNDPNGQRFNIMLGTNMSVRKDVLFSIGGFDPEYRGFFDDADISLRTIRAGYSIVHNNEAIVFHARLEGLTRRGYFDYNWSEIMKTTMYFVITNFWKQSPSKTKLKMLIHPVDARIRETLGTYLLGKIGFFFSIKVLCKIVKGYFKGIIRSLPKGQNRTWIPARESVDLFDRNKEGQLLVD